ncbi:universal stress protein [Halovivax gelatinilyticus]|uniref:universal stress protein n=1 Tax=Halovivax gelatinilyticus TaxID=2961597 RepID=UPI0020CA42E7|nr:universal stress protein [Halovivax gelatinilyticus]
MYRDLLITTDGSDVATTAAGYGLAIANRVDATAHVVSVVEAGHDASLESVPSSARREADRAVESIVADAEEIGVTTRSTVLAGRPGHRLLTYADEREIDLIACGTTGRTGMRRLLVGSVATEIIRGARQPVLSVGPAVATVGSSFDSILVATDGRPGVDDAVDHAISFAETYDATLHALYVVDETRPHLQVIRDEFQRIGEESTTTIDERASAVGVETVRAIEAGVPAETIVEYANRIDSDLIVVGTESRAGLERFVIGSVSQHVVHDAGRPVLTVRSVDSG